MDLREQLRIENEEKRQKELNKPPEIEQPKITENRNVDADIKAFNSLVEFENKQAGYKSLKEREQALADGEKEFEIGIQQLAKDREEFNKEQRDRVDKYNVNMATYKRKYELLQTKLTEVSTRMEEALELKSQAESVINSQTESEKQMQAKLEAYAKNMAESIELFSEIATVLLNQGYNTGRILQYDVALIGRMQEHKASNNSIADLIAADIDRINEVCESLQTDGKNDSLLNYLNNNVEYLNNSLIIKWVAPNVEVLK
jgi:hypothetical protein